MRHLIESASKLTEATQEQLNQMRQYIQTLTQALEMYPDMANEIEPRLQRLRAFVQGSQSQQPGDPNDPRGDQTNPPAGQTPSAPQSAPQQSGQGATAPGAQGDGLRGNVPDRSPDSSYPNIGVASQMERVPQTAFRPYQGGQQIPRGARIIAVGPQNNQQYFIIQPTQAPNQQDVDTRAGTQFASKDFGNKNMVAENKKLNEASININGADASEVAEILRMMQLAGASGAKTVDIDDINPGPKPCPICGKIHGPKPTPCGGGAPEGPKEPGMGDMIRMMSMDDIATEEADDGGFGDATTEPDEYTTANAGDVSDMIPSGDDLHKEKGSYPATAGGDNPMNTESLKARLQAALAEKRK